MIQNPAIIQRNSSFEGFKRVDTWEEWSELSLEVGIGEAFILLKGSFNPIDHTFIMSTNRDLPFMDRFNCLLTVDELTEEFPMLGLSLRTIDVPSAITRILIACYPGDAVFMAADDRSNEYILFDNGSVGPNITAEYYIRA